MSSSTPSSASPAPAVIQALQKMLRPIVKVMLAQGITLPFVTELIKNLMVDVAQRDFRIDNKPPTDSRISLLTGVHRKDVSRLRVQLQTLGQNIPEVVSLGSQLVALWLGDARYQDADGNPLALPRFVSEGGHLSFEALVAGVNSDIRSRVVLDEWLRLGIVRLDENNKVCLSTQAFVPSAGFEEKAFYFGHNLHEHGAAAARNLLDGSAPLLERSVHYDALSAASVTRLAKQSQELGMKALLAVNKSALAATPIDAAQSGPLHRMTFGVYFYTEEVSQDAS
jgi:hypothetical protein